MNQPSSMSIMSHLTSVVAVKAAIDECNRVGRERFLTTYNFRPSREYTLVYEDTQYDTKAIAAVAFGYQHGTRALRWNEFSGGKSRGHAAWALDRLGFHVTGINHKGWWLEEVQPTIDSYLTLMGLNASRAKALEAIDKLHEDNPHRTVRAFGLKFENISAALQSLGQSWFERFPPRRDHYQKLVGFLIADRLGLAQHYGGEIALNDAGAHAGSRLKKVDWAQRDENNRVLGRAGEQYVLEYEKLRLNNCGRPDLAAKIVWLAEEADGHGYDIASFGPDGNDIQIEVKTTSGPCSSTFFVSRNELAVSKKLRRTYKLYRVSNFPNSAVVTISDGPLDQYCELTPYSYSAKLS